MSSYYIGLNPADVLGPGVPRYFYGLRRTDEGELYFVRIDQLKTSESLQINNPGNPEDNYEDFEIGIDFFEGRSSDHTLEYENLNYEQYRWDDRSIWYYIDDDGNLVASVNKLVTYPSGI